MRRTWNPCRLQHSTPIIFSDQCTRNHGRTPPTIRLSHYCSRSQTEFGNACVFAPQRVLGNDKNWLDFRSSVQPTCCRFGRKVPARPPRFPCLGISEPKINLGLQIPRLRALILNLMTLTHQRDTSILKDKYNSCLTTNNLLTPP